MSKEYTKLDNFIRSYFNQDTVCELDSDDLGKIIDLYLSEVGQNGVKELLIDISKFVNDNKNQSFDKYFESKFGSYLDISPVEKFISLLNSKYLEKYPEIKSTVVKHFLFSTTPKRAQHEPRIFKRFRSKVTTRGFEFLPVQIADSNASIRGKGFKPNNIKRGARKPYYVLVDIKPKQEAAMRVSFSKIKRRQRLLDSLKKSIEATDIVLQKNKFEKMKS
ncbi:contact-dependent growth inhibition system immunity protein [Escherichia coli]|uniref:contact-dependent growth inhibition system immunity protein n=1 Tax=Escherichia coli TaxID=562 RepID=UPI000BE1EE6F|nr:contact-dependent growth inhibition system immunity protein [Escherichia coli]